VNYTDKTPQTSKAFATAVTVLFVAIVITFFAVGRLSDNPVVLVGTLVIFAFLELVQLIVLYKTSSRYDLGFEAAFFVVFLSVMYGVYEDSLILHPVLLWSTILYRPIYMRHGNLRVAFVLSLVILGVVLPVTTGIVTDSDAVSVLMLLYALSVLGLWVFCSKIGTMAIDWVKN
jgi:hypothetical protein